MSMCAAKTWYERTRGLVAFTIPREDYWFRRTNQYATVYVFRDNSQLIVYRDFGKAYRRSDGHMMARRTGDSECRATRSN